MKQVVIMHGGGAYASEQDYISDLMAETVDADDFKLSVKKGWKENLATVFAGDFEFFHPKMPCKENAKYPEWKIWFEKLVPFLNDDVILMGHSLGGIFFAKYLSENTLPKKIKALFLVAAPYGGKNKKHVFGTFSLGDDFKKLVDQVETIFMYHSKDDVVVPFADFETYREKLPRAHARALDGKGHFSGMERFPELADDLRTLID